MLINFYYIKGISKSDTLYFANKTAQQSFFANHVKKTIDTTYYPPHYLNTIRLEVSDVGLDSEVNYLSFTYSDRVYYYFIKGIGYVNEDVYEIYIEMDTIQTYYFDITVDSCHIDRKFIDRYDSAGYINRDYIRENVSNTSMLMQKQVIYEQGIEDNRTKLNWFVIRTAKEEGNVCVRYPRIYDADKTDRYYSSYCYYFVPYVDSCDTYTLSEKDSTAGSKIGATNIVMEMMSRDADVVDIQFVPWNVLENIVDSYTITDNVLTVIIKAGYGFKTVQISTQYAETNVLCLDRWGNPTAVFMDCVTKTVSIDLQFAKNTKYSQDFKTSYVPALMDNNYMLITFGEGTTDVCSIDLYGCIASFMTLTYQYSPLMVRRYYINATMLSGYTYTKFSMKSYIVLCNIVNYDVINDTYNTWKSQNTFTGLNAAVSDYVSYIKTHQFFGNDDTDIPTTNIAYTAQGTWNFGDDSTMPVFDSIESQAHYYNSLGVSPSTLMIEDTRPSIPPRKGRYGNGGSGISPVDPWTPRR